MTARRAGRFGILTAEIATPLSMVLTELLQNALEHGFGPGGVGHASTITATARPGACWRSPSRTTGAACPPASTPQQAGNLGLQIVRTLVVGELGGTFDMVPAPGRGTRVVLELAGWPAVTRAALSRPVHARAPVPSFGTGALRRCCVLRVRTGAARCGSVAGGCASGVWRCGPGCGRRGASSRGARPR